MVTDNTLSVDVFTSIRSLLVATQPFITNSTTSATTSAEIRATFNDIGAVRPQIILNPIEVEEKEWKFGSFQGKKVINIAVDCYGSNTLGVDQLRDQVEVILKENPITGIDLVGLSTSYAQSLSNDEKYHLVSIIATYDRE